MKRNKIILSLVLTVAGLLFLNMGMNAAVNYCHDEDAGKFSFHVEQAIHITSSGYVDLGAICPGCSTHWECGDPETAPYISFWATGSLLCPFKMTFSVQNSWTTPHISLDFFWYYWTGERWRTFSAVGQTINFMDLDGDHVGDYHWGAFICDWVTDCEAPAGDYWKEITVYVDYVCQ
jgi:hypothetical protein